MVLAMAYTSGKLKKAPAAGMSAKNPACNFVFGKTLSPEDNSEAVPVSALVHLTVFAL